MDLEQSFDVLNRSTRRVLMSGQRAVGDLSGVVELVPLWRSC